MPNESFMKGANLAIQMYQLNMQKQEAEEQAKYRRTQSDYYSWLQRKQQEDIEGANRMRESVAKATQPYKIEKQIPRSIGMELQEETVDPLGGIYRPGTLDLARTWLEEGKTPPKEWEMPTEKYGDFFTGVSPEGKPVRTGISDISGGTKAFGEVYQEGKEYAPELKRWVKKGAKDRYIDMNKLPEVEKAQVEGFTEYVKPEAGRESAGEAAAKTIARKKAQVKAAEDVLGRKLTEDEKKKIVLGGLDSILEEFLKGAFAGKGGYVVDDKGNLIAR